MTEPKRFTRGRHSYTRWGSHYKEVRVHGKPKKKEGAPEKPKETQLTFDVDSQTEMGHYANAGMVYQSPDGTVLDFAFLPPGSTKGRVHNRVILHLPQMKKLAQALNDAVQSLENS